MSSARPLRSARTWRRAFVLALALVASFSVLSTSALASSASITITADNPPPPSALTGAASTYTINLTCSAVVGSTCGANPTITIPLDLTSVNAATPAMSTWAYSVSSGTSGLVTSGAVVAGNYVITLNESALVPGDSDTISLSVTPPNNITPDATTWSLTPTFSTVDIPGVTAPAAALGAATASALLSVSKVTSDGGAVYVIGNNVIYNISARCNSGAAKGNLYLTSGSLVDTLPADLDFVSATPAPTSEPSAGANGAITWNYPTAASLPSGCSATGTAATSYQVIAEIDPATLNNTSLINSVTLMGTPIGTTTPATVTANRPVTAISVAPANPGSFVGKSAKGPLSIPSFGFDATYAGHWILPINARPSNNPGAAEGEYTVTISYPASRAYETDLAEPVPCLDNLAGVVYSSSSPSGAINGSGSINNLCQHPAFDPTVVQVSSASLASAVNTDGWTPTGIEPNGTTFALTLNGTCSGCTSAYFEVPSADVGHVAAIELGPDSNLTDVSMSMNVWGYGDATLVGGNVLDDIATATAYPVGATSPPTTVSHSANLYIEPTTPQLGVLKTFGTLGAAPGGTTALTLTGNVSTPATLPGNVVLTDLLPFGLTWANPSASGTFKLTAGSGATSTNITGTVTDIANFQSTGRELIRVSFPAASFVSGFYTITPPTNFIELTVPTAATTYNNTDQLFVAGIAQNTSSTCGPGTTSTASTFESSDPLDLAGDGLTTENYCQWAASLTVPPTGGPSFTLVKTVQGDLDSVAKYSPGVGQASSGGAGTGTYSLQWSNTGGNNLTSPVVYDILPYIGDTGVSGGQSGVARGSAFAPVFAGISGSLPGGVTVKYSMSTNPCRPEVYASQPSCVNDWTSVAPGNLGLVKALQFDGSGTYAPAQSFTVSFLVTVPAAYVNVIAWNSAASDAQYNGSALLPAEPPKVGLQDTAPALTPTLLTAASAASSLPGAPVTDAVTVANTGGGSGALAWQLLGPIAPAADGTCNGLTWTSAASFDSGSIAVAGDGSYPTTASTPSQAGCYSYAEQLTGSGFAGPVSSSAGTSGESFLVPAATLTTTATATSILPGGSVADSVQVTGTGGGGGSIAWQLLGPVAPAADGTCNGLTWSGAASFDSGTIVVSGDGSYPTTASMPTAVGCYSYAEQLSSASAGGPTATDAGVGAETFAVASPTLATAASSTAMLTGAGVSDAVTVGGTEADAGSIAWQLLGPVAPSASGSCSGLDWTTAATAASGSVAVTGDGVYDTPMSTPSTAGCYSYAETLTGSAYGPAVSQLAGVDSETLQVSSPPAPTPTPTVTPAPVVTPLPVPPSPVSPSAHLSFVKTVNHATATFGAPLTYTLTVTNSGPGTATGVTMIDAPKTAMRLVSAQAQQGSCNGSFPLTCAVGTLAPNTSTSVTVVAVSLITGPIDNGASVTSTQTNAVGVGGVLSAAASRIKVPLGLTKRASAGTVRAGQTVRYEIGVSNPSAATAEAVRVCDQLPGGLVFVSASVRTRLEDGSRCWTIAALGAHGSLRFRVTARALPGASGTVVNLASVSGPAVDPARARASVDVLPAQPRGGGVTG